MSPGGALRRGLFGAGVLAALLADACGQDQPIGRPPSSPPRGVVVQDVETGYAAARGGLRSGDVLLAWRKGNGGTDRQWRPLDSPVDLALMELTGGQVGELALRIERQGVSSVITLPPAPWKLRVRARLSLEEERAFEQGKRLLEAGQVDEAVARWQALAEGADPPLESWLSAALARALIDEGHADQADPWIDAALRSAATAGSADLHAWIWLEVGDLRHLNEDHASAAEAYTAGLELAPGAWQLAARLRRVRGDARYRLSEYEAAAEDYRSVLEQWMQKGVTGSEYLAATVGLGKVERNQSQFEGAAARFEETVDTARTLAPEHPYVGFGLYEQGMLAYWQSDLARAEEHYRGAAQVLRRLGIADNQLANLHMGLGIVSFERGDLTDAEWSFSRARSIFRRRAPESLLVAWTLRGLGSVALARNELVLARKRYEKALGIIESLAVHRLDRSFVLREIGIVAHAQGDLETARGVLDEALRILETDFASSKFPPRIRTALAAVLMDLGEVETARGHLTRALNAWERLLPGSLDHADTHFQLGELLYRSGEFDRAREHHRSALAIRSRLAPHSSIDAESYHALGRVALGAGSTQEALDHLLRALESIEAQLGNLGVSETSRARYRQQQADVYKTTIDLLMDLGRQEQAFDVLERYRAQLGRELLDLPSLNLQRTSRPELASRRSQIVAEYEKAWRELSTADAGPGGRTEVERLRGRLAELEQERQIVRERMRSMDPAFAAADPGPARWKDLRDHLDPGTGILSFSVGHAASWLFAVFDGKLRVVPLGVGEKDLSERVQRFRMLLAAEGPGGAGREALTRHGRDLYRLLIAAVEEWMAPAKEFVVLPDGPLHRLPFAALLRDGAAPQYLVEWKPLFLRASLAAPGGSPDSAGNHPREPSVRGLLAFGGVPVPGGAEDSGARNPASGSLPVVWPDLPFARAELRALGDLFGSEGEVYIAEAATEQAAKRRAEDFRYLHFATHSRLDSALPLDSFLLLSPSGSGSRRGEDGFLRAWEVIEEMRLGAEVVTLSACETGLGEELGGHGLLGLMRAFRMAGARSVVASLWQVNDRSTSALMVRFYRGMRAGLAPHEALRQAQIDLLRGEIPPPVPPSSMLDRLWMRLDGLLDLPAREQGTLDYSHPHHWAAFQIAQGAG